MNEYTGSRRLTRATEGKMIGGVCAGLARYFNLDPTVVRVVAVLGALLGVGSLVLVYLVMWVVVPADR